MKDKNKFLAFTLWLFLGVFGGHRFYLGSLKVGFVYLALIVIGVVLEDSGASDASDKVFVALTLLWLFDLFVVLGWKNTSAVDADSTQSSQAPTETAPAGNKEEDYGMNQMSEGPAYPEDGITDTLDGLNPEVWDRGYYHETSDGTWYEVYVTDTIKGYFHDMSLDHEDFEHLNNYACINLDHYQDDNQITFFVPDGEEEYTLGELTEMFI